MQRQHARRNGEEGAGPGAARRPQCGGDVDLGVLPEHIGYVVRRAQLAIFKDFIQTLARVDIRPAQYSTLIVIGQNPGLTQAALGRALAIKRANLVGMLNELERRKLARRVASPSDRRSHALYLTGAGRQMLARFQRLALEHEKRATRTLDPAEKRTLLELLTRVARSLG
ncbi:MAG TPA: MarR family transcriptional regulator [Alphaproteobacteria bacterium]|jgi:DNA-binding MarR family transcriptional regulator